MNKKLIVRLRRSTRNRESWVRVAPKENYLSYVMLRLAELPIYALPNHLFTFTEKQQPTFEMTQRFQISEILVGFGSDMMDGTSTSTTYYVWWVQEQYAMHANLSEYCEAVGDAAVRYPYLRPVEHIVLAISALHRTRFDCLQIRVRVVVVYPYDLNTSCSVRDKMSRALRKRYWTQMDSDSTVLWCVNVESSSGVRRSIEWVQAEGPSNRIERH